MEDGSGFASKMEDRRLKLGQANPFEDRRSKIEVGEASLRAFPNLPSSSYDLPSMIMTFDVIEDNFPQSGLEAAALRSKVVSAGKLVSGLLRSTEERKRSVRCNS
jgi:hypothetical protein